MQTKLGNDFFFAKTPYKDRVFVSQGLNGVWSKKENMYRFPKNLHAMRELLKSYPELLEDESFIEAGKKIKQNQERFLQLKAREDVEGDTRLRNYQRVDVEYLKQLPSAAVLNEPRTGKSLISLKVFREQGLKKNCIVCPASLVLNWAKEMEKFNLGTPFPVIGDLKKRKKVYDDYKNAKEGYLIISYETLRKDVEIIETM
jgi:SNF2 family DNA or RNA helicase